MENSPKSSENVESTTSTTQPAPTPPVRIRRGFWPPGVGRWVLAGFVGVVLLLLLLPMGSTMSVKGSQTKALAQAKQIGLALGLFAGDHDGNFPRHGVPAEMVNAPENSNRAFACLFPTYCQSKRIFGNKASAYQLPPGPDDQLDPVETAKPVQILRPGENVYSYVVGLTDKTPEAPLVLDGTDGTGHYNVDSRRRGGVWSKSRRAVLVRADNSATLENLAGPDDKLFLTQDPGRKTNLLDDLGRYGPEVRLLDPAVPGSTRP